jgi:outer membrane receptor protein involved in Fe transport
LFTASYGYFISGDVDQRWAKFTGRFAANWTPKLDFTDQTLLYGSFSHGYKAGGANPPGAVLTNYFGDAGNGVPIHPATFDPEYVDAYELGTKNTLADGALTLNGNMFFYNYTGYQISEIVDRTSINLNVNATVKGAELEATYEPLPGLKFNFAGGYEQTRVKNGQSAIDLMDRTAGHSDWMLMKPFPTQASNCIFPDYVVAALVLAGQSGGQGTPSTSACGLAYNGGYDPALGQSTYFYNNGAPYAVHSSSCGSCYSGPYPVTITPSTLAPQYTGYSITYPGFDPRAGTPGDPYQGQNTYNGHDYGPAPNNGEGFAKDLGGNELPNAPHFTVSASVDYTIPVTPDWASTFHVDYYWQDYSWARVFNDNPYDRLRGYTNINLALILTSQNGWQVMGYLKNVFNVTDVTGAFLNSDDSGLTTNIFLTDPRLFGLRVTKNW